jgi:predicted O-methyltransferase YrrM
MFPPDRLALIALLREIQPKVMVEFGCNIGFTAKVLFDHVPGIEEYIGVDVPLSYKTALPVQQTEIPTEPGQLVNGNPKFHLIIRPRGTFDLKPEGFKVPVDAVLIDGDHGKVAVAHDTELARKIVRQGGIIFWHDYWSKGVPDVCAFIDDQVYNQKQDIKHIEGTWLAFQRV